MTTPSSWQLPTNTTQGNEAGLANWSNIANIEAVDNTYATVSVSGFATSQLVTTNTFDFSGVLGILTGIEIRVEASASRAGVSIQTGLIQGSTLITSSRGITPTTSEAQYTLGGASDLWGTSLTLADIQNSNFGVAFNTSNTGFKPADVSVDSVEVRVYTFNGVSINRATYTVTNNQLVIDPSRVFLDAASYTATDFDLSRFGNLPTQMIFTNFSSAGVGAYAWVNPSNAQLSDNTRTTVGLGQSWGFQATITEYLSATGPVISPAVGPGKLATAITVGIEGRNTLTSRPIIIEEVSIYLPSTDTSYTTTATETLTANDSVFLFDTFAGLPDITSADLNDPDFEISFRLKDNGNSGSSASSTGLGPSVDFVYATLTLVDDPQIVGVDAANYTYTTADLTIISDSNSTVTLKPIINFIG